MDNIKIGSVYYYNDTDSNYHNEPVTVRNVDGNLYHVEAEDGGAWMTAPDKLSASRVQNPFIPMVDVVEARIAEDRGGLPIPVVEECVGAPAPAVAERKLRLLVVGHGRHGKDTVCEYLRDAYGLPFFSSSEAVGAAILPILEAAGYQYRNFSEAFHDRHNHRAAWYHAIALYNSMDATRLARSIFEAGAQVYCGMRRKSELDACLEAGLFDLVIWVDASERVPPEDSSSIDITADDADVVIRNNGKPGELYARLDRLMRVIYA